MARNAGESTLENITLTQLNAVMKDYPNVPIKIGKGCIKALTTTLGVDFSAVLGKATVVSGEAPVTESETPATNRPAFTVE